MRCGHTYDNTNSHVEMSKSGPLSPPKVRLQRPHVNFSESAAVNKGPLEGTNNETPNFLPSKGVPV